LSINRAQPSHAITLYAFRAHEPKFGVRDAGANTLSENLKQQPATFATIQLTDEKNTGVCGLLSFLLRKVIDVHAVRNDLMNLRIVAARISRYDHNCIRAGIGDQLAPIKVEVHQETFWRTETPAIVKGLRQRRPMHRANDRRGRRSGNQVVIPLGMEHVEP
jgi:hypothetical protein